MKFILTVLLVLIFIKVSAQTKDSTVYYPDSVNVISLTDVVGSLKYIEDKMTKKDYDLVVTYLNYLIQSVEPKRKHVIKVPHK